MNDSVMIGGVSDLGLRLPTGQQLVFRKAALTFTAIGVTDVFGRKNNRTVGETLSAARYRTLKPAFGTTFESRLNEPLGQFLLSLKRSGDRSYRRFLNPYGDSVYATFNAEAAVAGQKGLYCFLLDDTLVYLGRCLDRFGNRLNQGYGVIHPKNCYLDGQATNCHVNALIAANVDRVSLYVCSLEHDEEISLFERQLIGALSPRWNIALCGERRQFTDRSTGATLHGGMTAQGNVA